MVNYMEKYDVIIIGGACAGLSAAIYTGRRELKTLVLTKDIGGQIGLTTDVENYPGFLTIKGPELAFKFKEQAEKANVKIQYEEVKKIEKNNQEYSVVTNNSEYSAPVVILAFGLKQRQLGVPGEKELTGRGVAYCATCDGPLYKGKTVAVVGGGNSAFDAAEYLSTMAEKVYLLSRNDQYKAEDVLIETVKNTSNIEMLPFNDIEEFIGDGRLEKIKIKNNQNHEIREIDLQGVFIEIGWESQVKAIEGLSDLVNINDHGYVQVDNQGQTSVPGIYAAGDVTDVPFKQAIISAGEGAKAAMSAALYLQKLKGLSLSPDWKR